jgi:hypothetical protein
VSVDVYADLSARTPAFVVKDDAGEPATRRLSMPPLGAGVVVTTADTQAHALSATVGFHTASGSWDTEIAWAPTTWTFLGDLGWRFWYARTGREAGVYTDLGAGLRVGRVFQPWWPDYVAWGVGEHIGLGYATGSSWTVEVRGETCWSLAEADGELDSAAQDLTWAWRPSSLRAALQVGRVFR